MTETAFDVLVVGAGHAGAQVAISLSQRGFMRSIGVVGDEPELPYERPPLSKEYLAGEKPFDRLLIRAPSFWSNRGVSMLLGRHVARVDASARRIVTSDGDEYGYGSLVWAAGGSARRLICEGSDLAGVHTVRDRRDVDRLRAELDRVGRVVIVGAGYIGLEAAAVLTKHGKSVVLLEALPRVLMRVAGEPLSLFIQAEHRAHGVDLRLEAAVSCLEGRDGRVTGVRLADGELLAAEMVIVGVGISPSVQPLLDAGAQGGNGVLVDAQCRTSLPHVFAVGDCALHASRFAGGREVRIESVQNANDQAMVAAATLAGVEAAYDAVPWFWSNQYDLRLQTVGLLTGHDRFVVRGDPASRSFSVVYLRDGRVIAVDAVNAIRDYVQGRRLVVEGIAVDPLILADVGRPFSDLI